MPVKKKKKKKDGNVPFLDQLHGMDGFDLAGWLSAFFVLRLPCCHRTPFFFLFLFFFLTSLFLHTRVEYCRSIAVMDGVVGGMGVCIA